VSCLGKTFYQAKDVFLRTFKGSNWVEKSGSGLDFGDKRGKFSICKY